MPRRILDPKIMAKLAKNRNTKDITAINNIVSKKASKYGISSEAALIILAKEYKIGTSSYLRSLDSTKQEQVRNTLALMSSSARITGHGVNKKDENLISPILSTRELLKRTIENLIEDQELLSRCKINLMLYKHFDIPINQATLVLEDRIRNKAQPSYNLVGENLVGYSFNEDISKTVLRVASNDPEDQRGFTQILRGIVPAFRNKTHHHIIDTFSREEAIRVCGFIDVLLRVVDNSVKIK